MRIGSLLRTVASIALVALLPACGDDNPPIVLRDSAVDGMRPDAGTDAMTADGGDGVDGGTDGGVATDAGDGGVDSGMADTSPPRGPDVAMLARPRNIALGEATTCALELDGKVYCWGEGGAGQLGAGPIEFDPPFGQHRVTPRDPVQGLGAAAPATLDYGRNRGCVVDAAGVISCWGQNGGQQEFLGASGDQLQATALTTVGDTVDLAVGDTHACALRREDGLACWGGNAFGQLGADVGLSAGVTPLSIMRTLALSASGNTSCVLTKDTDAEDSGFSMTCFGANGDGQAGTGASSASAPPTAWALAEGNVLHAAVGVSHGCAIVDTAETPLPRVVCWGKNDQAQLGDGSTEDRPAGVALATDAVVQPIQVAVGDEFSCALEGGRTVKCWGNNNDGQVGANNGDIRVREPTQVIDPESPALPLRDVLEIAAGGGHACARRMDRTVVCWGRNTSGQLGDGTRTSRRSPVVVMGLPKQP